MPAENTDSLEERKFALDAEMQRREISLRETESRPGSLSAAQATFAGAVLALVSGLGGALIAGNFDLKKTEESGHTSITVAEIEKISKEVVEKTRYRGSIEIEKFNLQKDLIIRAIEKPTAGEVRNTLSFFAKSGFLDEYKEAILTYLDETPDENLPTGERLGNVELDEYREKVVAYRPILDLIGKSESNGNYNSTHLKPDNVDDPKFTEMPVREVVEWQRTTVAAGSPSSAIGKYLFLRKTVEKLWRELGLTGDEVFNSLTQDILAVKLLEKRGLEGFVSGKLNLDEFALNLSMEWATLPVPSGPNAGESYYHGDGLNEAQSSVDDVMLALRSILPGSSSASGKPSE